MTAVHPAPMGRTDRTGGGPGWRFAEWLFGIVGGIAVFLGVFILFADPDEYVGLGGDLSWRVGDISDAWIYGFLIGGGVLVLIALAMVVSGRNRAAGESMANRPLADLLWHAGIFLAVNAFIWVQDLAIGDGIEYAYWVTVPWAIGLAAHTAIYLYTHGRVEEPLTH